MSRNRLNTLWTPTIGAPTPSIAPGTRVAQADLRPNEIQDLAEVMGELLKATTGLELRFKLRIELSGKGEVPEETVSKANEVLRKVADGLRLE